MQQYEQIQRSHKKRTREEAVGTFPDTIQYNGGNDGPDSDEVLAAVDAALRESERLHRELGHATHLED